MATRKIYTFHTDISRAIVRNSMNGELGENDIYFHLSDGCLLRFFFEYTEDGGQNYLAYPLPPAATLTFAVKDPDKILEPGSLIYSAAAQWNLGGDWADVNPLTGKCCVRISCATEDLRTFLAASGTTQKVGIAEVAMHQEGEDDVTLVQFRVGLRNDVIRGIEGVALSIGPALATVPYVDHKVGQMLKPDGGRVDLSNGTMTLWDDELQAWITYGSKNGQFVRITP